MSGRREGEIAYGSFLLAGIAQLIISLLGLLPGDSGVAGVLGFLVVIPLFLSSVAGMLVGCVFAFRLRHASLVLMAVLTLLLAIEFIAEFGPVAFYNAAPVIYSLAVAALSARWFLVSRRATPQS